MGFLFYPPVAFECWFPSFAHYYFKQKTKIEEFQDNSSIISYSHCISRTWCCFKLGKRACKSRDECHREIRQNALPKWKCHPFTLSRSSFGEMEQSNRETNMRFKKQANEYCFYFPSFVKCETVRRPWVPNVRSYARLWGAIRLYTTACMANIPGNVCKTFGTCSKRLPVTLRCPSNLARMSRLPHGRPRVHPAISRVNWNFWGSWSFGGGDGESADLDLFARESGKRYSRLGNVLTDLPTTSECRPTFHVGSRWPDVADFQID